VEGGFKGYP